MNSKIYEVQTLFKLACETFCLSLKDARQIEKLPLPQLVKRGLRDLVKDTWLKQQPVLSPLKYNYARLDLLNMSRTDLNMLMNYPVEDLCTPEFLPDTTDCHVVWSYFAWENDNRNFHICKDCYNYISILCTDHQKMLCQWGKDISTKWNFFKWNRHECMRDDDVLYNVIWKSVNYCDICIVSPLYVIIDREECCLRFFHHMKRHHVDSSSDSETDSESGLQLYTRVFPGQ